MLRMNRVLGFAFLLMGFTFTVTQGLLIRELLVAFFGNELSIGLVLGNWLLLEAIGSGLGGRLAYRWGGNPLSYAVLQVLFALFLPLCLYAATVSRAMAGAIPGEGVGLVPIYRTSFLVLAPLGLIDGAMFSFACRAYADLTGREAPAIGRVYVLEALGALVGGAVFTYLLISYLHSVQIVVILVAVNLFSAALILGVSTLPRKGRWMAGVLMLLVMASLVIGVTPVSEAVQEWLTARQWSGQDLVYSENSVYGNVAVVRQGLQHTFYADGIPILTSPVPDVAAVEELVHFPLLFVEQPTRALVLSGGVGGVLRELEKYPFQKIDYAELDPLLLDAVALFSDSLTGEELEDPRVSVERVDGRLMVRTKLLESAGAQQQVYDLAIINLPYPSTLQLNRFYSEEFFGMLDGLMRDDGVLVVTSPGSLAYLSDELRGLNVTAYHTLGTSFPYVRPIPGDITLWLASRGEGVEGLPAEQLAQRWQERDLETQLITADYVRFRLDQRYLDWFWSALGQSVQEGDRARAPESSRVNRDLHPIGLFHGLSYWNALFSPSLARVFALAGGLRLWPLGLIIAAVSLLYVVIGKAASKGNRAAIPVVIITTGFAGMTADLVIVFAFQTFHGHVYHWIGLLITAFMAGLSLGGLLMTRRLTKAVRERSALLRIELSQVVFWVGLPIILGGLSVQSAQPLSSTLVQGLLLMLNSVAGFLVGAQFPLANRMWFRGREAQTDAVGVLYACDLVGAFLASVAVAVFLIPILGIVETCLLVAVLKAVSLTMATVLVPRF